MKLAPAPPSCMQPEEDPARLLPVTQVSQGVTSHHKNVTGSLCEEKNKAAQTFRDASARLNDFNRNHIQQTCRVDLITEIRSEMALILFTTQSLFSFESFFLQLFWNAAADGRLRSGNCEGRFEAKCEHFFETRVPRDFVRLVWTNSEVALGSISFGIISHTQLKTVEAASTPSKGSINSYGTTSYLGGGDIINPNITQPRHVKPHVAWWQQEQTQPFSRTIMLVRDRLLLVLNISQQKRTRYHFSC